MKDRIRLTLFLSVVLAGCGQEPDFTSYDDCILKKVGSGASERAIDTVEQSCKRKFEVERDYELTAALRGSERGVGDDDGETITVHVVNTSPDIVTQFSIDLTNRYQWRGENWIEPGRGTDVEITIPNSTGIKASDLENLLAAKTTKVIPVND